MKKAAIADCWRNLGNVVSAARGIVSLAQVHPERGPLSVNTDGLFAIVGANGAGKSSFFEFLTNMTYNRLAFYPHQVELYGGINVNIPAERLSVTLIDPYLELRTSNNKLLQYKSTFGQEDLNLITDSDRGLINYVLGSAYERMQIEEVEVDNGEVCPRFVVSQAGSDIDNESLSLGEQLVLYLYWVLARKYKNPGIFFLEEPEAGLSPAAQYKLVDLLAYLSAERKKQVFLATHSPFIISALGKDRVIVMKKAVSAEWTKATGSNYLDELGMDLGKVGIFFLEDNKAKVFFEKLLDIYGSYLRKSFDIRFLSGESDVYEVVNRIGNRNGTIKIVGILDADQKGVARYNESAGTFYFLPGTRPPEKEMIDAVISHHDEYARSIGVQVQRLSDAIRRCTGYEHHDFFEELSKDLFGVVKSHIYENAFGVWYGSYPDKAEIHDLIRGLDPDISAEDILAAEGLFRGQA